MNPARSASAEARANLRLKVFALSSAGVGGSEIARLLGMSRQRVSAILKTNRDHELKRGLGSSSKENRLKAKPEAVIPSWLYPTIFCPIQAIRNTCFEHGFRFEANHGRIKAAIKSVFGLDIPIRTLQRYRFDSVQIHHLPDAKEFGIHMTPLSASPQRLIAKGKSIEQIFGAAICSHHDLDRAIIEDRRNRLSEIATRNGSFLASPGPFWLMPFWFPRHRTPVDARPTFEFRERVHIYLQVASSLKSAVLALIQDDHSDVCPTSIRPKAYDLATKCCALLSTSPYLIVRRYREREVVKVLLAFNVSGALAALGHGSGKFRKQIDRICQRLVGTCTDLPPALSNHSPVGRREARTKLYADLIEHGWDSSQHHGRPEDNQLRFHR
jgi:hypothetical protein